MDDLLRRALETNRDLLALGNEAFPAAGGHFVRNRELANVWDANHVASVTARAPDEIEALLARAGEEFAFASHRRFDLDPLTPPEFEARLALEGYSAREGLMLVLEGELRREAKTCHIRPVETDADWEAYGALFAIDWRDYVERSNNPSDIAAGEAMLRARRVKATQARYWLAWVEGVAAAYLLSWEGNEGVGQVEDLMTHPDYRHRGLATALIHHCVADCRARGAGPVIIVADVKDTPKEMYAALGFRPLCVKRNYLKRLDG